MTSREKEILSMIKQNSMISQQEIADTLGIARSSVAVHIANLVKKGYIKGKGYVLGDNKYVTVIGGANVDIQGFSFEELRFKDSNPGKVKVSAGGVGRNIAENLSRLGIQTKLISAFGDDLYGEKITIECRTAGVDIENCLVLKNSPSSSYLSILDGNGDMKVAISDMDIINELNIDFIKSKSHIIENSSAIVIDTNLSQGVIEYLLNNFRHKTFFMDTVSITKARKVSELIGYFHTIKPNIYETEELTGIKISGDNELRKAAEVLINKGVKRVFISLGSKGVFYKDQHIEKHVDATAIKVVNATGAGDAFMAGLLYCYINNMDIDETIVFSMSAAEMALSHENTINPNISAEKLLEKVRSDRNVK
ncbi:pseudouridine kinase [Proteiniborus ethanoligenes]|uniref:Pseudouridine kinase n=1 Tax=Proteiniborus ethanoligenes TaxID=415015 RepID=A0A1H3JZT3_9FIRM|nr:PfkB family carbohydrate kinase [Proteiniborus ethanoligenes]TAH63758.1 MAG: winged helix-turn-helix transcriptional regulator [Gottschalkiaceae bacterium]SDY45437.1 pseudouridine kinase [Proteiniborus ethanoligenes]